MPHFQKIFALALALNAITPATGNAQHIHQLLWDNSLKVHIDYNDDGICCDVEKCEKFNCPESFNLVAEGINPPFCFLLPMGLPVPIAEKIDRLKKETVFSDGYGFIHTPCDCNSHGANGFMAFKLGDKPKFLGYLQAEENPYSNGKFFGSYEPLEAFSFGAHGESPSVAIVMREKNGSLFVDENETRENNESRLVSAKKTVDSYTPSNGEQANEDYRELTVAALRGAQILKYTNMKVELNEWLESAKKKMSSDDYKELNCLLEAVHPFEMVLDEGGICQSSNKHGQYDAVKETLDKCHGDYGISTDEWMARLKNGDSRASNFLSDRASELVGRISELREIFLASSGMQRFNIAYLMKDIGPKVVPIFKEIVENRNYDCGLRDEALSGMGWTKGGEQDALKEAIWAWKEDRECLGKTSINIFSENQILDATAKGALLLVLTDPSMPAKLDKGSCNTNGKSSQVVSWAIRGLAKYPGKDTANAICRAMNEYGELGQGTYALGQIAKKLKVSPHSLCDSQK